jgi:DNA polymerase bacteriophage-type
MSFVTLDFETYYAQGYSLQSLTYEQYIGHEDFYVHGVGIKIDDGPTNYYDDHDTAFVLKELFAPNNDHTLIAHNAFFDGAVLSWYYGLGAATYYCTQAMSRALWNQRKHGLADLAVSLWPKNKKKRKGKELADFKGVRRLNAAQQKVMGGYCVNDVNLTFDAFAQMWRMFPEDELALLDLTLQMGIHPGFELDAPMVQAHLEEIQREKAQAIAKSGTTRTVLASGPQFVKHIKDAYGLDVPRVHAPTPKNPDNVKACLARGELPCIRFLHDNPQVADAFAGRFAVSSTLEESRATRMLEHAKALPGKPEGVIALPLNYAKAHTLRWGGTNKINAQNFGRKSPLRRAIRAPAGYKVGVGDLSQIEARMLAWWADEESLLEMFANKVDIYSVYGSKIYGRPIDRKRKEIDPDTGEEVLPDYLAGHVGKTSVLGLGYQMGPNKFKDTLEGGALGGPPVFMDFEQCHHIVHNVYRAENPNIVAAWNECNTVLEQMFCLPEGESYPWRHLQVERGRLRLPNGMYLNYPGLRWVQEEHEKYGQWEYWQGNYYTKIYPGKLTENIIQALARIVIGAQMLKVNAFLKTIDPIARVLLTVHDEIICLLPADRAAQLMEIILEMMRVPPDWCNDGRLVLDSEGGFDDCYSK